jgi:hypothetical protein
MNRSSYPFTKFGSRMRLAGHHARPLCPPGPFASAQRIFRLATLGLPKWLEAPNIGPLFSTT